MNRLMPIFLPMFLPIFLPKLLAKLLAVFCLILMVFSPLAIPAEVSSIPSPMSSGAQPETAAVAPALTPEKDNRDQIEPAKKEIESPDASELRKRNLGDAFKIFKPSEAISADNAVPFPIDI